MWQPLRLIEKIGRRNMKQYQSTKRGQFKCSRNEVDQILRSGDEGFAARNLLDEKRACANEYLLAGQVMDNKTDYLSMVGGAKDEDHVQCFDHDGPTSDGENSVTQTYGSGNHIYISVCNCHTRTKSARRRNYEG